MNDATYVRPAVFDERAAVPVLVGLLLVVHALSRFRSTEDVAPSLVGLLDEPALHAMSALRTTVGRPPSHTCGRSAATARESDRGRRRQIRKAETAVAR